MVTVGSQASIFTVTTGATLVKTGHSAIRRVRFVPPSPDVGDIEVNTLEGIRNRGGPREFLTPQRLDFDLLIHIKDGAAVHTVDFTDYALSPGDVLWVRAGQVHRWGTIADIDGAVVMFGPHSVDDRTSDLIRSQAVRLRNHWSAGDLRGTPVMQTLELMAAITDSTNMERGNLRQAARAHVLATLLLELDLVQATDGSSAPASRTHEVFTWFRDQVEENFRHWHTVSEYATRLGYTSRTLNRLARQHTTLSAKEFIDERLVLEAKRMLSHADASVAEIADDLGFDDASNFSSYFRRQTFMTPGAFRNRSRGGSRTMPTR